jgi:DNA-binding NarL/FixJ family response regulator
LLIADADAGVRAELRTALEERGFEIVAEAASVAAAVRLATEHEPDLCLVDAGLPGGGSAAVARLTRAAPRTSVVVLADRDDPSEVVDVLERGAVGYLLKHAGGDELAAALRGVANGEPALSRRLVPLLVQHVRRGARRQLELPSGTVELTAREWDVGELLCDGRRTDEIAARLGVSPVTVRRHVGLLMKKIGAPDRDAAVETLRRFAR